VLIAYVFWPVFIPYAAYRAEPDKRRRIPIILCQIVGLVVGLNYLLGMLQTHVQVSVYTCNLSYQVSSLWNIWPAYIVAVSVPFLISSRKGLVLFGMAVLLSFAAGLYLASQPALPSVWCFFAAVLSASLYAYFRASQHTAVPQTRVMAHQGR